MQSLHAQRKRVSWKAQRQPPEAAPRARPWVGLAKALLNRLVLFNLFQLVSLCQRKKRKEWASILTLTLFGALTLFLLEWTYLGG